MNALAIKPLEPGRLDDYLHFFDTKAFTDNPRWAACYCYFPLHDPKQTDWQQRTGSENRAAFCACVAQGKAQGYLAYLGDEVIGWCNAGPWALFPMLQDVRQAEPEAVGVIFCFVVAPEHRSQGVATALLAAACEGLQRQGMKAVQARPVKEAATAAANHLGPLAMYLAAGFRVVREQADGSVIVRRELAS